MSGRKQHFIPQSLLRGFGRKGKGDNVQVVAYTHDRGVFTAATDGVGAERNFYSELALEADEDTLDDKITTYEDSLAEVVSEFRDLVDGSSADECKAAEVIVHLVVRNDHFRKSISSAASEMFAKFAERLAEEGEARAIFGIAGSQPSPRFQKILNEQWEEHGSVFSLIGWSKEQFDSFMFQAMQANFGTFHGEIRAPMAAMFANILEKIPAVAANAQRRSLEEALAPDLRVEPLRALSWRVQHFDRQLILPDCVAVGLDRRGDALPLIFAQDDEVDAVCMPLSSHRLLIGNAGSDPSVRDLNEVFASCSWDFFVAADKEEELDALRAKLRTRANDFLEKTVREALAEVDPESQ